MSLLDRCQVVLVGFRVMEAGPCDSTSFDRYRVISPPLGALVTGCDLGFCGGGPWRKARPARVGGGWRGRSDIVKT